MNRRAISLIIVGVVLAASLIALIRPSKPLAQLKIVRFIFEQDEPVVVFRVEAEANRWMCLTPEIYRIEDSKTNWLFEKDAMGRFRATPEFLGPPQVVNWFSDEPSPREFVIAAPPNSTVWKLRLGIAIEDHNLGRRSLAFLKLLPRIKLFAASEIPTAMAILWKQTIKAQVTLESDLITNSVPPRTSIMLP